MAGEIAYKLTADEAQALQAVARLSREFGLTEGAIKKAADASKELERGQQQMSREAQRMWEDTRTSAERSNAELARAKELFDKGAIDAETYGRRVKQVNQEIADSHKSAFGEAAVRGLENF